jgi:uncharacterized protein (TIGR00299 family) protein
MKILYYECFAGISGDMNLGALVDLGVPEEYLISELAKLSLQNYEVKIERQAKNGIGGIKVDVLYKEEKKHRNYHDIEQIINKSALCQSVKDLSLSIFLRLAEAEAKVHQSTVEEIHFHEVGALDAIIDIVGAAICVDFLKPDKIICSTIELGGGFTESAHGRLPVPAPATAEIFKDIPVKSGRLPFEATTPTGAAIIAATASEFTDNKDFKIQKIGYGIGSKTAEIPNVLRVFLGEDSAAANKEENYMLECNIDDMNPEIAGYLLERLFSEGARDAFITPIIMKKSRPAFKISVLCGIERKDLMEEILFRESTTFGIRSYRVEKSTLKREFSKVNTPYGEITVKKGYLRGELIQSKPEVEECKKIAREQNVPLKEVLKAAIAQNS